MKKDVSVKKVYGNDIIFDTIRIWSLKIGILKHLAVLKERTKNFYFSPVAVTHTVIMDKLGECNFLEIEKIN